MARDDPWYAFLKPPRLRVKLNGRIELPTSPTVLLHDGKNHIHTDNAPSATPLQTNTPHQEVSSLRAPGWCANRVTEFSGSILHGLGTLVAKAKWLQPGEPRTFSRPTGSGSFGPQSTVLGQGPA